MTHSNDGKSEKGALRADQNNLMFGQGFSFSGYERDPLYLNLGTKKFLDISGVSGIDSISDGRSAVFADFDNDGDLDVFSTTIQNRSHLLFRNNVGQDNKFLRVELQGDGKEVSRDAFGAVVRVKTSAGILTKIKSGGSGFISQNDPRILFGLGSDPGAESVEVTWPNGKVEGFSGEFLAGETVLLRSGSARASTLRLSKTNLRDPLTRSQLLARSLKVAIGNPLPNFLIKSMMGKAAPIKSKLRSGRQTLINVWATWCIPCAKEMPELEKIKQQLAERNIDILGINVDIGSATTVDRYVKDKKVTYPIVLGGVKAIQSLFATDEVTVPFSILVDENGIVRDLIPGWSAATARRFASLSATSPAIPVKQSR